MREIGRRFPRHLGKPETLDAGMYCATRHETMAGDEQRVHVRCPDCGGIDTLDARYTVLPHSGLVTPRWACPSETCGYVERLTLEAWEP